MQSLRDKIVSDGILIDDDTADGLVACFRNAGVLLSEDPDSIFFKNGNGNGNGNAKASSQSLKKHDQQINSSKKDRKDQQHQRNIILLYPLNNGRPS